jgi:hypothetical protein
MLRFFAIILLSFAAGCSTIVRPPVQPAHPAIIYLTDQVIHSSVLMPTDDGRYVEYAAGDWEYAALDRHDLFHATKALFFSPQGALGRRYLTLDIHAAPMSPELQGMELYPVVVDRDKVEVLEARLGAAYEAGKCRAENPENHFVFTKVPGGYGLLHNCDTLTKRCLREMGCTVVSRSPFAMYRVQH